MQLVKSHENNFQEAFQLSFSNYHFRTASTFELVNAI